jgi:hypothetical protein
LAVAELATNKMMCGLALWLKIKWFLVTDNMLKWVVKHKVKTFIIGISLFFLFVIVMPLIINSAYYADAPFSFLRVKFSIDSLLEYYGAVLTFVGTTSLGIIAVLQTYNSQIKTDKINKQLADFQKRFMAIAEKQFDAQEALAKEKSTPIFSIRLISSSGNYTNMKVSIKNVSDVFVSELNSISFELEDKSGTIISSCLSPKISSTFLRSGDTVEALFKNTPHHVETFTINWKFSCKNLQNEIIYFVATLFVENHRVLNRDEWKTKRTG